MVSVFFAVYDIPQAKGTIPAVGVTVLKLIGLDIQSDMTARPLI